MQKENENKIGRREFLNRTVGASAVVAGAPMVINAQRRAAATRKKPNFIFMYTDDQRYDAIRAMGRQPWLRTPNMDRLMLQGANFKNSFVTTSLCSPSRSSLLTGCYPHTTGVTDNERTSFLRDNTPVVFPSLKKAGYSCAYIGKVHVPNFSLADRGLDFLATFPGQGVYFDNPFQVNGKDTATKGYITDHINRFSLEFLEQRDKTKPFCMYIGHKAVHSGFEPDPQYEALFKDEWMPLPKTWDDTYEGRPSYLKGRRKSWHGLDGMLDALQNRFKYNYSTLQRRIAACLVSVDNGIRQIIELLKKSGELDNTIFIYSSDNGFFTGEHGLNDKRAMYEDSIRVPYLVHWPAGIKPGSVFEQMVLNIDLAPTLLDFAGVEIPSHMHGRSWKPVVEGKDKAGRDSWLYEYWWEKAYPFDPTQYGIRGRRYKYIRYPEVHNNDPAYPMKGELPYDELYDLEKDPLEMRNLAKNPASAGVLKDMQDLFKKTLEQTGYPGGFK
ncbi:MAG: sulfatase [Acidobacteria bacterium]|jgi:N-acetylglucosamine-6-sulfatase|nr:sulfatase [Acidobacteriota bacterium]